MTSLEEARFIADKMLGRLARWLRILGCDVLYGPNFSGKGLLQEARHGRRIVLTRDRRLVRDRQMPPYLLVESDHFREQVRQVVAAFSIDPTARLFRRCIECNAELEEVSRQEAAGRVPEFVYATQEKFRHCPSCRHFYWNATHVARVRAELNRMGFSSENH